VNNDSESGLTELARQVERMRVHQHDGKPSPYKPFVLLVAIRRTSREPRAERLMPYDAIASDLKALLDCFAPGSSSRGQDAFIRLDGEPFWEVVTAPSPEGAGRAADRANLRGGFTEPVHQLLARDSNANTIRSSILDRWIDPEHAAAVRTATE
jgi:hypothetical protein